jgi:hypothetical protein
MMLSRAARTAGKKPPNNPIATANPRELATITGDREKEKASSANEAKFRVEMVKNRRQEANKSPRTPPNTEISKDSTRKATRMLRRRNPRARNVPISIVRFATEAYIVIIAPMMDPVLKIAVMIRPTIRINVAII